MAVLTLQGRMALQLVGISVTVVCVFLRFWVQRFSKSTGRRAITPANLAGDLLLGLVLLIAVTNVTLEVYICLFLLQNTPPVPPEIPSLEWEKTVMEYQAKMLDFTKMSKKVRAFTSFKSARRGTDKEPTGYLD